MLDRVRVVDVGCVRINNQQMRWHGECCKSASVAVAFTSSQTVLECCNFTGVTITFTNSQIVLECYQWRNQKNLQGVAPKKLHNEG